MEIRVLVTLGPLLTTLLQAQELRPYDGLPRKTVDVSTVVWRAAKAA